MKSFNHNNTAQINQYDCGVAVTLTVLKHFGIRTNANILREYIGTDTSGSTLLGLQQAFNKFDIPAKAYEASIESLAGSSFPAILHVVADGMLHYIVLHEIDYIKETCTIYDPRDSDEKSRFLSFTELNNIWKSKIILLTQKDKSDIPVHEYIEKKNVETNFGNWAINKLHEDYGILLVIVATSFLVGVLTIAFPVLIQMIVDHVTTEENSPQKLITLIFIALLGRSGINYLRGLMIAYQSRSFSIRLVSIFFRRTLKFPKSFFNSRSVGDLVSRINDSRKIQSVINYASGKFIVDIVTALITLSFLFYYSIVIGIITLTGVTIWAIITYFKTLRIVREQELTLRAYSISESAFIDSITGFIDIKAAQAESLFSDGIISIFKTYQDNNFNLKKTYVSLQIFTDIVSSIVLCVVIYFSVSYTVAGYFTVGEMVAVYQIASISFGSFSGLIAGNILFQESKVVMKRLYEYESLANSYNIENKTSKTSERKVDTISSINLKKISFAYPGRSPILEEIDFEIQTGDIALLYGDNGTGKSTIGMLLTQLVSPSSGKILLNKLDAFSNYSQSQIRSKIGILVQNSHIFNTSIFHNIFIGSDIESDILLKNEEYKTIMKNIGLNEFVENLPNGIHTIVGDGGVPLSGGQAQMICILRLLLSDKQVLIFDEPTTALDRETIRRFFKIVCNLKHKIVLIISHRKELSTYATKTFELKEKRIQLNSTASSPNHPKLSPPIALEH